MHGFARFCIFLHVFDRFCTFLHFFANCMYLRYTNTYYKVLTFNSTGFLFLNTVLHITDLTRHDFELHELFNPPKNVNLKVSFTKKPAKTCKKRAKTCKTCKNVYLKFFWTLFKNVHCQGPCILRPCISRPYCTLSVDLSSEDCKVKTLFISFNVITHGI